MLKLTLALPMLLGVACAVVEGVDVLILVTLESVADVELWDKVVGVVEAVALSVGDPTELVIASLPTLILMVTPALRQNCSAYAWTSVCRWIG